MRKKKIISLLIVLIVLISTIFPICVYSKDVSLDDYAGKRIGVQTGTIFVDSVSKVIKNPQTSYFSTLADCGAALEGKKIDAFIGDGPVIRYLSSNSENIKYLEYGKEIDYMAVLSAKTDKGEKYIKEFNEFLKKLKESGEFDKITAKWFDGNEDGRVMEDYSSLPDKNGVIKAGSEATFPPFEYVKNNKIVGFEPELMYLFCKEYGYKLEISNVDFGGIIAGVTSGKFDFGVSGFSITEERKKQVLFSDVVYESVAALAYYEEGSSDGSFLSKIKNGFNNTFIIEERWKMFVSGLITTLEITLLSIIFGALLGFVIYLLKRNNNKIFNKSADIINWIISGMPIVVFLMILFYIIFGKSQISETIVAIVGFTIIFACSTVGILKVGENAIDEGQEIAARALGYTKSGAFFKIVFPQSLMHIIPLFKSEIVSHIKATAVVGYIAVVDITKVGDIIRGRTYDAFFPLIAVAVFYYLIALILKVIVNLIYKKVNPENRNEKQILKGVNYND